MAAAYLPFVIWQKQLTKDDFSGILFLCSCSQMFCKRTVLKKIRKIRRKLPMPKFLFDKIACLQPATLFKTRIQR